MSRENLHATEFFRACDAICREIDTARIEQLAADLKQLRDCGGRLFLLGVGGSAGNCGHAVNDFRKLCGIQAYAPTDNVSELTARANDEGWETIFAAWLEVSCLSDRDAILIFSVGGGDLERNISPNIVKAIDYAKARRAKVFGIVGRETGYTARQGDVVVVVPQIKAEWVTPLSEAFQAVVWHCLVSHPSLQVRKTKW
jgi:D-sedoheptulose 7-phosphate isomerase